MSNDITLVLGATGKTGRRITARSRLRGKPVRAASRSSETRFDWSGPGTWDAACGTSPPFTWATGPVREFAARGEAAGVRRLVLLSGRDADTWGDSALGLDIEDYVVRVAAAGAWRR